MIKTPLEEVKISGTETMRSPATIKAHATGSVAPEVCFYVYIAGGHLAFSPWYTQVRFYNNNQQDCAYCFGQSGSWILQCQLLDEAVKM